MNDDKYKNRNKKPLSFTIDEDIAEEFIEYTSQEDLNRSAIINDLISEYLRRRDERTQSERIY